MTSERELVLSGKRPTDRERCQLGLKDTCICIHIYIYTHIDAICTLA